MKRPIDILRRMPKFGGFLAKKPLFAMTAARSMALSGIFRRPTITAIEYAVTLDCQAACDKCSSEKMLDRTRPRLDHQELKELGNSCRRLGVYEINFTGGEPLLDEGLEEIISCFGPKRAFIGVNTNGQRLDEKRIRSLARVGVDLFKISLDSPVPEEHDKLRGLPGLFHQVFDALKIIRETPGVRGHLCVTTTRDQVESGKVAQAMQLAKEHDATIGFVFPSATGGWTATHEVLLEDRHRKTLNELADDPDVFLHGNLGEKNFHCPCGTSEIYLTCHGDVIPCPFIQISFGNVREESLEKIWKRMSSWPALKTDDGLCHATEDRDFIKTYTDPLKDHPVLPLPYNQHPNIGTLDLKT